MPRRPSLHPLAALTALALLASPARADDLDDVRQRGQLVWGGDQEGGGPYIFPRDDDPSQVTGFEVALAARLAQLLGVRPVFSQGPWDRLPDLLRIRKIHIILNGYELTPAHAAAMEASDPYYRYALQLLVRRGDPPLSWDALRATRGRVGTLTGSAAEAYLQKFCLQSCRVSSYDGSTSALREVETRKLDATLQDTPIASFYAARFPGLVPSGEPVAPGSYVIYARRGEHRLVAALNDALRTMRRSGELEAILRQYGIWNDAQPALAASLDPSAPAAEATGPAPSGTSGLPTPKTSAPSGLPTPGTSGLPTPGTPGLPTPGTSGLPTPKTSAPSSPSGLAAPAPAAPAAAPAASAPPVPFAPTAAPAPPPLPRPGEGAGGEARLARVWVLVQSAGLTVVLAALSFPLAMAMGMLIALGRLYGPRALGKILGVWVEFLRGTPLMLQLYFVFFVLPEVGIALPAFWTGVLGLAVNYSAYESEIYRAGLQAVPPGQMEAALALGMSRAQALRWVVIPQAARLVIPPMVNDFIALFKDTSVCSVITLIELTKRFSVLSQSTQATLELMALTALLYLAMSYPLALLARHLERRLAAGQGA